jgi:hypothetical protein
MSFIETEIYLPLVKIHHYQGTYGKFKKFEINGIKSDIPFDEHFPTKWIMDERKYYDDEYKRERITGPFSCAWCCKSGLFNGVFIGYCTKCAEIHDLERGHGLFGHLTDKGIPYEADHCITNSIFGSSIFRYPKEKSMWNTYMKDVDLTCVGDVNLKEKYNKNGYFCDVKEEVIKGYYCTFDEYYEEKALEEEYYRQQEEYDSQRELYEKEKEDEEYERERELHEEEMLKLDQEEYEWKRRLN